MAHTHQQLLQPLEQGSDEGVGLREQAVGAAVVVGSAEHARSLERRLGVGGMPVQQLGATGERRLTGTCRPLWARLQPPGCAAGAVRRRMLGCRHGVRTRSEHADAQAQGSVEAEEQEDGGRGSSVVLHGAKTVCALGGIGAGIVDGAFLWVGQVSRGWKTGDTTQKSISTATLLRCGQPLTTHNTHSTPPGRRLSASIRGLGALHHRRPIGLALFAKGAEEGEPWRAGGGRRRRAVDALGVEE